MATKTKKRIENGKNVPQWIDAKDVNVRDFIGFPVPTYSMDNPRITEDDCYFMESCLVMVLSNLAKPTAK